ncbi:MAG: hypothetical protein KDD69_07690 [Bdellovibrionales bacterium]|nr:hypothetical protein [Bdellovibrionales bacterium]
MSNMQEQLYEAVRDRLSPFAQFQVESKGGSALDLICTNQRVAPLALHVAQEVPLSIHFKAHPRLIIHTNTIILSRSCGFGPLVSAIAYSEQNSNKLEEMLTALRRVMSLTPMKWLNVVGISYKATRLVSSNQVSSSVLSREEQTTFPTQGLDEYLAMLNSAMDPRAKGYAKFLGQRIATWSKRIRADGSPEFFGLTPFFDLLSASRTFIDAPRVCRGYIIDNPYPE